MFRSTNLLRSRMLSYVFDSFPVEFFKHQFLSWGCMLSLVLKSVCYLLFTFFGFSSFAFRPFFPFALIVFMPKLQIGKVAGQ